VVDGPRLLLTPLQHELVPPPMASVVAACSAPVQSVSFRTAPDGREVGYAPRGVILLHRGPAFAECTFLMRGCSTVRTCCIQELAALLSDGSVAVFAAPEEDFWGEVDGGAAVVAADDGDDSEAMLQPERCVSVTAGAQGFNGNMLADGSVERGADHAHTWQRSAATTSVVGDLLLPEAALRAGHTP
jgi:IKI3 family